MIPWYNELGRKLAVELTPGQPPTLTDQLTLNAYLTGEALQARYGPPRIAIFFDEVESVMKGRDEQGQPFSDAFFMTLRALYQGRDTREGLLTIGLAGAVSASHLVKEPHISPFNVGHPLNIDDFTHDESLEFTKHLSDLSVEVNDDIHPLLEDANIQHATKMLRHLPEIARPFWERIRRGTATLLKSVDNETFTDLYITGVIKNQNESLVIRNRIYTEVFVTSNPPSLDDKTSNGPQSLSVPMPVVNKQQPLQPSYTPTSFPPPPQANTPFLADAERQRLVGLIQYATNGMSEFEIRNILANCSIPQGIIDHIDYSAGSTNLAHALLWKLERGGDLHPRYQGHSLGTFLAYLAENELIGFDAALSFVILIFKYHLIRDQQRMHALSSRFQIPLPIFAAPSLTDAQVRLSLLPDSIQSVLPTLQLRERLESLYHRGIRHYVDPQFFMDGHRAISAVCRIEFDKKGEGTGFLVAPDLVLTNYHIFRPEGTSYDLQSRASQCQVRFGAKRDEDGSEEPGKLFQLHSSWLADSSYDYQLDYLLLRLAKSARDGLIEPVTMAEAEDVLTENAFVNIIHHPLRGAMEISLRCNEVVAIEDQRIYYLADTEDGSSGAPVFNDHWRVVALHRSGGEVDISGHLQRKANAGIPIGLIRPRIAHHL